MLRDSIAEELLDSGTCGEVAHVHADFDAGVLLLQLVRQLESLVFALGRVVVQGETGAFGREVACDGGAEVLATAGDEGCLALEGHCCLVLSEGGLVEDLVFVCG